MSSSNQLTLQQVLALRKQNNDLTRLNASYATTIKRLETAQIGSHSEIIFLRTQLAQLSQLVCTLKLDKKSQEEQTLDYERERQARLRQDESSNEEKSQIKVRVLQFFFSSLPSISQSINLSIYQSINLSLYALSHIIHSVLLILGHLKFELLNVNYFSFTTFPSLSLTIGLDSNHSSYHSNFILLSSKFRQHFKL